MIANIEEILVNSRRALIKNPTNDEAKSALSWCIFNLLQIRAEVPKEIEHIVRKCSQA